MPELNDLVLVIWRDAWYDPDESAPADWRADYPIETVGILARNDGVVSVAQEKLPDEEGYRAVTHIPREMVEEIRCLTIQSSTTERTIPPTSTDSRGSRSDTNPNGQVTARSAPSTGRARLP